MPITDPEKRREYMRKYQKERREKLALHRRELRQKNLAHERARATAKNRAKGHAPRPHGARRRTRVNVSSTRRWVIFEDRLYTNSQIGYTLDDLRVMRQALEEQVRKLKEKAKAKA